MFKVRILQLTDYKTLENWWKWFRFPAPPKEFLPQGGTGGIMVMKDGIEICAGFIYFTNSKLAWLEYIVSNPEYRDSDRESAIQFLIYTLTDMAKKKGYGGVFTSLKNQRLIKHYEACGYLKSINNTTEMVIKL